MSGANVKTVYKLKRKNLAVFIGIILGIALAISILVYLAIYIIDYCNTNKMVESINKLEVVSNIVDDEKTKPIAPPSTLSKFDNYWNYIKLGLMDIDMVNLKKTNVDTVGYIEIKGTEYSYPVVKGEKDFYKNHSFDKTKNNFGWIYLSDENDPSTLSANNIIYGNKQFMGLSTELEKLFDEEWKDNDDNYIIRYYTNDYTSLWQIISVYKSNKNDHIRTSFESDDEIQQFANDSIKKSEIKFKAEALPTDNFLTITTNSNRSNIVVLAKLIKIKRESN